MMISHMARPIDGPGYGDGKRMFVVRDRGPEDSYVRNLVDNTLDGALKTGAVWAGAAAGGEGAPWYRSLLVAPCAIAGGFVGGVFGVTTGIIGRELEMYPDEQK